MFYFRSDGTCRLCHISCGLLTSVVEKVIETFKEFTTASKIRFTLVRINTFGEELFGDPNVLRSYYYAISKITVGGYCKCNGHANNCDNPITTSNGVNRVCSCEHNTEGEDCERCKPLYNNKPWAFATSEDANECEKCDCNKCIKNFLS